MLGNQVICRKSVGLCKSRDLEGTIKSATISKQASGWYISILCEVEVPEYGNMPLSENNNIGIDLGLIDFIVTFDGNSVPAPKFYRRTQKHLARTQRTLSRRKKVSNRRKKQQQKVARLHEKVANGRRDFLHKLSI